MTSHDVVDAVRRMAGQRKVGHAGTLDPMATGVLLVCLGQATRITEFLVAGRKRYRAAIVFGSTTDTYDAEGKTLTEGGRVDFSCAELETALGEFVGRQEQVPPLFSALKRAGQPLYALARKGETVLLEPRAVEIDEIELVDWNAPTLIIEVACSPGTYIRSLAHDLGKHMGSGAYLGSLVRMRSGRFLIEDASSLERLNEAFQRGQEGLFLRPLDEALFDLPAMVVGVGDTQRLIYGRAIEADRPLTLSGEGHVRRAYSSDGTFLAIVAYDATTGCWQPQKVFAPG